MAIGEAGRIITGSATENEPITVTLTKPLVDPVIVLTGTAVGGDPYTLRVIDETVVDGKTTEFTFIIEEWEYLDGPHPAVETVNWLAVEEGLHTLPDGRVVEAGFANADHTNTAVGLTGSFGAPPVVLTSVSSNNDTTTVDSDPLNITASGFNVRLQEEEGQDGVHAAETVGWIAIEPGGDNLSGTANAFDGVDERTDILGLGDTFSDSIVLADTQTIRGGNPETVNIDGQTGTTVGVFIREEQSGDSEVNHINEIVGIAAFENGLIPCFAAGTMIATPTGEVPVEDLAVGDLVCLHNGGTAALVRAYHRHVPRALITAFPKLQPIHIAAGALGGGLPSRDLRVSRQHRMLIKSKIAERMFGQEEVLVPAVRLLDLRGVREADEVQDVTYVHLLFDRHEIIFAEDTPTESLFTGAQALRALEPEVRAEILTLFPELQHSEPEPVRFVPPVPRQRRLIARHRKNHQPLSGDGPEFLSAQKIRAK